MSRARSEITTPDILPEERSTEASLRPSRLDEFVGQAKVKENLQIAIDAARGRGEQLDHALFFGPPGLGKTTLAILLAKEMGVNIRTSSGPVLERPGDLVGLLTGLKRGDILFIDEIHRMRPVLEEFLYPAMEDWRVDVRVSDGPHAETIPMALEPFTLIGATTRYGLLTPPMRARFGMVERLNFYPGSSAWTRTPEAPRRLPSAAAARRAWPTDCSGACATTPPCGPTAGWTGRPRAKRWPASTWTSSASTTWTRDCSRRSSRNSRVGRSDWERSRWP
jgi:hypothetical protein